MDKNKPKTLSLDAFKTLVKTDETFKKSFQRHDSIDFECGTAVIYRENLMKELERFACKDEEDLIDTLYYSHGIFARVVD